MPDSSQDVILNGVALADGTVVAWSTAFPRNWKIECYTEENS